MDPNQPPTLEYGIPDPETYLPGTPDWYWWFLTGGIVLTILAILWLLKILFHRPKKSQSTKERDLFTPAMKCLEAIESDCDKRFVSELAAEASLAIRTYLAGSRSEPALYETAEEFQARQGMLPPEANGLLNDLNDAKYAKSQIDQSRSFNLIKRSRTCLENLRRFEPIEDPQNRQPPPLDSASDQNWFRRTIVKRSLAGIPMGIILALIGLLGGSYQRRGVGAEIQGNELVWSGVAVSVIALIIFIVARSRTSRI